MATATAGLPKIGSSPPLPNTPRGQFAQGVALRTGLNPWVVYAWTLAENTDQSVQRRPFNFLNFKSFNGKGGYHIGTTAHQAASCDPATDGGCFPGFHTVQEAAAATADLIQRNYPTIRKTAGQGAGPQLTAIGHSQWGTSGSLLSSTYNSILRAISRGDALPHNVASGTVGGSPITLPGGTPLPGDPAFADPPLISGISSLADFFSAISSALQTLFSLAFWLRVGQVVGGAVLILAGALILSRGELAGLSVGVR